jgi:hypothetical protein
LIASAAAATTSTVVPAPGTMPGSALTAPMAAHRQRRSAISARSIASSRSSGCLSRKTSASTAIATPRRSTISSTARSVATASRSATCSMTGSSARMPAKPSAVRFSPT